MSWTLLRGTLHQRRWGLFWYSFGLVLYSWMMAWFWPQFGEDGTYELLVESIPEEMLALFGDAELGLNTLGGYFHNEYLGLMWVVIAGSAVIIFAARTLAGEVAAGTMELLLAQPISRLKVVVTRIGTLAIYAAVITIATFLPIAILGPGYDIDLSTETYLLLSAQGFLFLMALGGVTMALSSVMRDGAKPGAITGGLLLTMWIMAFLAQVSELAEDLEAVNLLTYWKPGKIIESASVEPEAWWVFGGVALVTLVFAVVAFTRRDVA